MTPDRDVPLQRGGRSAAAARSGARAHRRAILGVAVIGVVLLALWVLPRRDGVRAPLTVAAGLDRLSSASAPTREASALATPDTEAAARSASTGATEVDVAPDSSTGVTFVVTFQGAPVRGSQLWVISAGLEYGETNDEGRATLDVTAGEVRFGVDRAGHDSCDGWFRIVAIDGAAPPAGAREAQDSASLEVAFGARRTIALELATGASIFGRIVDADGAPRPGLRFYRLGAHGDEWVDPMLVVSDEAGYFTCRPLAPGWYLLGPDPGGPHIFPYERLELARGERRDVELRLLAPAPVRIHVDIIGDERGAPWPLPLQYRLERADGLGGLVRARLTGVNASGAAPLDLARDLQPGPWRLHLQSARWWGQKSVMIAPTWKAELAFEVTETTRSVQLEARVADTGSIARLACTFTPLPNAPAVQGAVLLSQRCVRWTDRHGAEQFTSLPVGIGDTTAELLIDLDEVPSRTLEFVSQRGSLRRSIATVVLREGAQSVSLDFGGE